MTSAVPHAPDGALHGASTERPPSSTSQPQQQQQQLPHTDYVSALAHAVHATVDTVAEALQEVAAGADLSTALGRPQGASRSGSESSIGGGVDGGTDDGGGGGDGGTAAGAAAAAEHDIRGDDHGGDGGAAGGSGGVCEDEFDWDQLDIGRLDGAGPASSSGRDRRQQLAALKQRVMNALLHPRHVQLRDKLSFMIGSCQVWAMAYLLGYSPENFYYFYTAQTLVLMTIRFLLYRHKKIHYYMLDFCYFANCLTLAHIWLAPRTNLLAKVTFAFNTGPLSWSIAAFRNSLVFHDLDRVTSVFIHLVPCAVSWTLRWHPDASRFGPPPGAPEEVVRQWQAASLLQLVVLPMLPYLAWSVGYYLKIFVISADKIRARGYVTLFSWVTSTKRGVFASITRRVPERHRPQVYLFLHWCFCATTFMLAWLCWRSFWLHTLLVVGMGLTSLWNGSNYYFTVFAARYLKELEQRLAAQDVAAAAKEATAAAAAPAGSSGSGESKKHA